MLLEFYGRCRNVFDLFYGVGGDRLNIDFGRKVQILLGLVQVRERHLARLEIGQQTQNKLTDAGTIQLEPSSRTMRSISVTGTFDGKLQSNIFPKYFLKRRQL